MKMMVHQNGDDPERRAGEGVQHDAAAGDDHQRDPEAHGRW